MEDLEFEETWRLEAGNWKDREGQQARHNRGYDRQGGQQSIHEKPAWSAEALLNTLWFMNSINFRDVDGTEYLEYSEWQTKPELDLKFKISEQPSLKLLLLKTDQMRETLRLIKEKRPNSMLTTKAPLYLSINYWKDSGRCWFEVSAMNVNKLNSLMKTMANKAGLDTK